MDEIGRQVCNLQPRKILDLRRGDDDRNACRKSGDNRVGHELDHLPQPRIPRNHQNDARHECGQQQPVIAVLHDHAVNDDDEGTGGAADLHF